MRKQIHKQNLDSLVVEIEDNTLISEQYFFITYCENEFRLGKNLLRFKGNPNIFTNESTIGIEIMDYNEEPIYYESYIENNNAVVSIYITDDLPQGNAEIILCGCVNKSDSFNVRWKRKVYVNVEKSTDTEIVYTKLPSVYISANTGSYADKTFDSNSRIISASYNNIEYYQYNNSAFFVTSSLTLSGFPINEVENFVYFDTTDINSIVPQTTDIQPYTYNKTKLTILNEGIAKIDTPLTLNTSTVKWLPTYVNFDTITIRTEQTELSSANTENKHNLLTAYFTDLDPSAGYVSKIRSFYRSLGQDEWIFSNITNIESTSSLGFTPNEYTASLIIPTQHRNDTLDFRFEFLNNQGIAAKQELITKNYRFIGGNTYIGGDDNLITGSLYVAGQTGTGVQISGRNDAAMLRSIGYSGFENALIGSGSAGFVLYSGSIQPLLNSTELYDGVGFELVANTASYFRYKTSGGGLLDIRTDNFFIGNDNTFISGSNNSIEILVKDPLPPLTKFHLRPSGEVTASAFIAFTGNNDTSKTLMFDTFSGLISGKNIGRNLHKVDSFTVPYTNTSLIPSQNILNTANNLVALNTGSILWQPIANVATYTLPYENAIMVMGNAAFIKDSTSATFPMLSSIDDAKMSLFLRLSVSSVATGSFVDFGNNSYDLVGGASGSLISSINNNALGITSTSYTISSITVSGSLHMHTPFKMVSIIPMNMSDKVVYVNLDYAVVRLNSNSGTTIDIDFRSKLTNIDIITTRTLMSTTATGLGDVVAEYSGETYPTA